MLKKLLIFGVCIFGNSLFALENLPVGRYQMTAFKFDANSKVELYLLDTATGLVWKADTKTWISDQSWCPVITEQPKTP